MFVYLTAFIKEKNININQQRIRQVFIDSAKDIINTQGVDAVSAREKSKISGYSHTTPYNYFKDIDSLLTYVAVDYSEESHQMMFKTIQKIESVKDKIIEVSKMYFDYMIHHPSIFKIIFANHFDKEFEHVVAKLTLR
ncbi:MAG TPA: TetR/AcrR family transcriptional regulator [Candidatus Izemoplasmatales bacterium]|nr:TetR/AcrR family transcriptional regulator [Candidatus Izemoplasmatales bacterium]